MTVALIWQATRVSSHNAAVIDRRYRVRDDFAFFQFEIQRWTFSSKNFLFVNSRDRRDRFDMAGQGSTGNVIAALCSFFIPGLGQLLQGRLLIAIVQFVLAAVMWVVLLGWLIHLWSILDAALYKPRG